MQNVNFSTAISFGDAPKTFSQSCLETVDSYFTLGGKKAVVIPGNTEKGSEGTILIQEQPSFLVTVLKVISYLTIALPLVMLIAKAILRSTHSFYIIDTKEKIEKGIDIPQSTLDKLQALMPKILNGSERDKAEGVNWIATGNNLVFSLQDQPNLIFKIVPPGRLGAEKLTEERFANMIKAKEVCIANKLDHLVIPHAKKLNIADVSLIVEERLNFNGNESAQEELYKLPNFTETAKELAIFIAKTGFSDVEWRNMPIMDNAPDFQGTRRVALIDLEEMDGAKGGIFGAMNRRGLISCLFNEQQIDNALAVAKSHGLDLILTTPEKVKAQRMEEIQTAQRLEKFYVDKGITLNARKPIQIADLSSLGLDLNEQAKITVLVRKKTGTGDIEIDDEVQDITLKDAIVKIVGAINKGITKTPENASTKGKREAYICFDKTEFYGYYDLSSAPYSAITEEHEKQHWVRRILEALIAKGHVFNYTRYGRNYIVQA